MHALCSIGNISRMQFHHYRPGPSLLAENTREQLEQHYNLVKHTQTPWSRFAKLVDFLHFKWKRDIFSKLPCLAVCCHSDAEVTVFDFCNCFVPLHKILLLFDLTSVKDRKTEHCTYYEGFCKFLKMYDMINRSLFIPYISRYILLSLCCVTGFCLFEIDLTPKSCGLSRGRKAFLQKYGNSTRCNFCNYSHLRASRERKLKGFCLFSGRDKYFLTVLD